MNNKRLPCGQGFLVILMLFFTLLCPLSAPAEGKTSPSIQKGGSFAITLFLSIEPIDPSIIPAHKAFKGHKLYITKSKKTGQTWYILRLGFFSTFNSAKKAAAALRDVFPDAMVSRVSKAEFRRAKAVHATGAVSSKTATAQKKASSPPKKVHLSAKNEKRLAGLMDRAKKAVTEEKYKSAIKLFTVVLKYPENKFTDDALELRGLAYERDGRRTRAIAEYKKYLTLYPKGEGAERVRQRLAGLVTARARPKKKLSRLKKKKQVTEIYGTFSQFYNRDESYTDLGGNVTNRSSLTNDLDITARRRGDEYELSSVFIGGYEIDFLGGGGSEGSISRFYMDALNRRKHFSGRLGRQWSSTGGVLGRFDGVLLSYSYIPRVKVNLVSGFPTDTSRIKRIDTGKYFYGINMDLGTFFKHYDSNIFFIQQTVDGIMDRQAVGGEVRYTHASRSFFGLVDYDTSYSVLNTLLVVGNWIFPEKSTLNVSLDYRKSPSLSTSNALQGQTIDSISELLQTYSEDEVRTLALDRTANSWSFNFGGTYPLNEQFQLSGDITASEVTGTDASGGAEAVPGTGVEYFLNTQLIGNNLVKNGDIVILGLRYSAASTSDTVTFNLNTRFPVTREWRVNPRFRVDYSNKGAGAGSQFKIRPTLRADYYLKRRYRLEFEGGIEWTYDRVAGQTDLTRDYFVTVGYRVDF